MELGQTVFSLTRKRGTLTSIGCPAHAAMSSPRLLESRLQAEELHVVLKARQCISVCSLCVKTQGAGLCRLPQAAFSVRGNVRIEAQSPPPESLTRTLKIVLRQLIACYRCCRGLSYLLVSDWPKTFKEAFCERYHCPSDQYLRRAFRKCLYRRAVLLAPIIMAVSPAFFQVDMDVIERIGSARSWRELHAELKAFSINSRLRTRPLRSQFRLRVSGNRICKLAELLFGPQKSSSGGG